MSYSVEVSNEWLSERADLHDGLVTDVAADSPDLRIFVEDEWVALAGLPEHEGAESPGEIVAEKCTILSGDPHGMVGGRISEVRVNGHELILRFSNRPFVKLGFDHLFWRSARAAIS